MLCNQRSLSFQSIHNLNKPTCAQKTASFSTSITYATYAQMASWTPSEHNNMRRFDCLKTRTHSQALLRTTQRVYKQVAIAYPAKYQSRETTKTPQLYQNFDSTVECLNLELLQFSAYTSEVVVEFLKEILALRLTTDQLGRQKRCPCTTLSNVGSDCVQEKRINTHRARTH